MKLSTKIAIAVIAVIVAVPLILLLTAEAIVNSSAVKPEIEKIVSEALEMDFKIQGRIDIRLLPLISVAANDPTVKIKTGQIASADRIIIDPRLRPLWQREVQIKEARIHGARLIFDPHAIDKIVALAGKETDTPLPLVSLAIDSFAIMDGEFKYTDDKTLLDFNDINFRGDRIEIIENREIIIKDVFQFLKTVSFTGKLAANRISSRDFKLENLSAELKNENGVLTAAPVALQYLGSSSKLQARWDLRQSKSKFESSVNLSGLSLKALAAKYFPAVKIHGKVNCTAELSAEEIQLELLSDYLSQTGKTGASKEFPIKSVKVKNFSVAASGLTLSNDTINVDEAKLNVKGDRWALIVNNRSMLSDFDSFSRFLKAVSFRGKVAAGQITSRDFKLENLSAELKNENGMLTVDPVALRYLGSDLKLRASLDLRPAKSKFESSVNLSALNLNALAATYFPAVKIYGKVDCTADLTADDIQLELLADYLSQTGKPAVSKKIPIKLVRVDNFTVAGTDLTYSDNTVNIDKTKLNVKGDRLAIIENNRWKLSDFDDFLRATKLNGNAAIERLTVPDELFENIKGDFSNNHGVFKADAIKLQYFGEHAEIGFKWNLKEKTEQVELRVEMPEQRTRQLLKKSDDVDLLEGTLNLKAEFKSSGADWGALAKNISGHVIIKGANMILHDVDLDKALNEFQKMGAYGLGDLFGLLTLGPMGTVVTQGYDQLESLEKMMAAEGNSRIQQIVSDWNVVKGVAYANDVAFSTARHRVAIGGKLDFINQRFGKITIAAVDAGGCIVNKEVIDGPFDKPEVKEVSVVQRTLVRPLKKFLATKCDKPFYTGSVDHPSTVPGKK